MPSLKQRPSDLVVAEGRDATFDCVFDGAAIVEWYAHGHDNPLQNSSRTTIWSNGSLTIQSVAKKDEGMFQCVAIPKHKGVPQQVFAARLSVACEFDLPRLRGHNRKTGEDTASLWEDGNPCRRSGIHVE